MEYDELRMRKDKGPYDYSLDIHLDMYDKVTYKRDASLCNRENLTAKNGNIIKFYRCKFMDKAFMIPKNYSK